MMTSFSDLHITLEHDIDEQYQYQPGEVVRGEIHVTTTRNTSIQVINITILGEGSVAWDDPNQGTFTAREVYVNATNAVIDENHSKKPMNLEKGSYHFPFEYRLADNIPSSFIGKYGSVTYILKATVQGEKTSDTVIATEPFLVLRRISLPDSVLNPVNEVAEKRYWKLCSTGKIKAEVGMSKTGVAPGEDLLVNAQVANKSPIRITAIQAAVIMDTNYHAQKEMLNFRQIVNKRRDEYELTNGDGRRWQNVRISVPPYIPESNLEYSDIINLKYFFQFRVETSGGNELKMEIPLLIGAHSTGLPLRNGNHHNINTRWTIGGEHGMPGFEHPPDYSSYESEWHGGVPELRKPDVSVNNPLFLDQNRGGLNGNPYELEEVMENTKL